MLSASSRQRNSSLARCERAAVPPHALTAAASASFQVRAAEMSA
jgi:hypothetical protein